MASKIRIFRQSAMEAGTPGKYHINPSPKLMSRASHWRVVEHEDGVELTFNEGAFDDVLLFKIYYNQVVGDCENKDDDFSYIVNTDFLNHREVKAEIKDDKSTYYFPKIKCEIKDAVTETCVPKIKGDENKNKKKKNKNKKKKKKN
ncbi:hypothetical protein MKW98_016943 [Papaver atlanticum]|uniref:Uncharacterized protein n=1 Tax=Papaver atlanticum TaxID=357466 RepID=A0AAD4XYF6_9MAGN|nr:hypothetical protein MKW98_016943 [Papaver atlanticum]